MDNVRNDKITRRNIRLVVVCVLAFSAITIAALMNKLSQPRILNKYELGDHGALLLDEPQALLDFTLQDQYGQRFDKQRLLGKWTVVFFGFTHCGDVCPTTLSVLAKTYGELKAEVKDDFQVVLVTVDPERDTPEVLKDYLSGFNPEFIGVTGVTGNLINFASQMNMPYLPVLKNGPVPNTQAEEPQHSANLVLVNPDGQLHGYLKPPFAHGSLRVVWRSIRGSYGR